MEAKDIQFGTQVHSSLVNGVDCFADAVRTTMGPHGRQVVLENGAGSPFMTKDGAAVARHIELGNRYENAGAQLLKEVILKMAEEPPVC
jgi:chaperonin GroEL